MKPEELLGFRSSSRLNPRRSVTICPRFMSWVSSFLKCEEPWGLGFRGFGFGGQVCEFGMFRRVGFLC